MKKKVLFINDSLKCGGGEKSLVSLLPVLSRDKYDITLMLRFRGGDFEYLLPDWIHLKSFPAKQSWIGRMRYSFYLRIMPFFRKHQHSSEIQWIATRNLSSSIVNEYDVVIAYQQGFPTYYVAEKVKAKKKIAWVNADIFSAHYNIEWNRTYYEMFDYIVPVSNQLKSILSKNYPFLEKKIVTIYDVINADVVRKQAKKSISLANCCKNTIVTVGRLVPTKNYKLAVDAANILKKQGLDFRWYFIGDGPERKSLEFAIKENGLEDNVVLLGLQINPFPFIAIGDIYVQTSLHEGFGMTISEAKILGKPIVCTNFDVVYDQIKHEENGLIAEMTADSVADSIMRLLDDETLRMRITNNVKSEENNTYLTEVQKIEKILDED